MFEMDYDGGHYAVPVSLSEEFGLVTPGPDRISHGRLAFEAYVRLGESEKRLSKGNEPSAN